MIELIELSIAIFGMLGFGLLAFNRIFAGCIFAAIGQGFWIYSSNQAEQWGSMAVLIVYLIAYLLGIFARWPRRAPPPKDEHEKELGI